jgi:hypothetical protein
VVSNGRRGQARSFCEEADIATTATQGSENFAAVLPGRTTGTASRRSWRIVEWTYNVRALNDDDRVEAERLLVDDSPSDQPGEAAIFHSPPVAV